MSAHKAIKTTFIWKFPSFSCFFLGILWCHFLSFTFINSFNNWIWIKLLQDPLWYFILAFIMQYKVTRILVIVFWSDNDLRMNIMSGKQYISKDKQVCLVWTNMTDFLEHDYRCLIIFLSSSMHSIRTIYDRVTVP